MHGKKAISLVRTRRWYSIVPVPFHSVQQYKWKRFVLLTRHITTTVTAAVASPSHTSSSLSFFPIQGCVSFCRCCDPKENWTNAAHTHTLRIHRCLNPFILYGIHLVGYMANIRIFFFCSRHSFLPETLALVCRVSSFAARRLHAERNAYNFSVESGNNRIAAKQQKFERGGGRSGCVWV